jgi:HMG (high mobility group) box
MASNTLIHESSNFPFPSSPSEKVDGRSSDESNKSFLPSTPNSETIKDSPRTPHQSAVTPLLQRGRMLQGDELLSCMADRPAIVDGDSPGRRGGDFLGASSGYGLQQPFHHSALQRLLSPPSTTLNGIHHQRLMHQRNMQMEAALFGAGVDSPLMAPPTSNNNSDNNSPPVSMMWGSDMGGVRHPGEKPKRPLSAYNFYFQLERERIIASDEADRHTNVKYTEEDVQRLTLQQQRKAMENKPKEKRSHRKTHGKISFGDLARTIANKWKQLAASDKEIFEGSAALEKERYRKELAEWNKQMKKWKEAAAKMTSSFQYHINGSTLNRSNHETMTPASSMNNTVVTPDQMPKKTIYKSAGGVPPIDHSPNSHMVQAMAQQRLLGRGPRLPRPHDFGRGMEYPGGNSHEDFLHPYHMNEGAEEDFYPHDNLNAGGLDAPSYTDEITEETYRMAQMMLPANSQRMHRSPVNPRRMKMLLLMQQRYRRQQMMLMQMHGQHGLMDQPMDGYDPMAEEMGLPNEYGGMDQLDDANYMDHGGHLVNNHYLQMQQASRGRRPRLDELGQGGFGGAGMDDPFAQNMMQQQQQNMMGLHNGTFDDRV